MKKVLVFQKICFKVKVLKSFKFCSDCHIKTRRSLKRRAILKIPSIVFRRTYVLPVGFKMKLPRKAFSCVKTKKKAKSNFAVKVAERSNHSFSFYLMVHFFQTSIFFKYVTMEYIELNYCVNIWKRLEAAKRLFQ